MKNQQVLRAYKEYFMLENKPDYMTHRVELVAQKVENMGLDTDPSVAQQLKNLLGLLRAGRFEGAYAALEGIYQALNDFQNMKRSFMVSIFYSDHGHVVEIYQDERDGTVCDMKGNTKTYKDTVRFYA